MAKARYEIWVNSTEKAKLIEKIINKEVPMQNVVLKLQWAVY